MLNHVWRMTPFGVRCFEAAQGGAGGGSSAIRAGGAFVELFVKNNLLYRGLDAARAKVRAFGDFLARIGGASIGFKAIVGPLKSAVDQLSDTAKLADLAKAFGLSADEASRLFGVFKAAGSDARDATEGLVTLGQRVKDAMAGGSEEATKLFDQLGVSAQEFEGLNPAEQFFKLVDALKQVRDPMTRVQLLLKATGEDTGKNLIGVLSMTDGEMRQLGDTFAMTAEEMEDARAASKEYAAASATLGRLWQSLAVALAPAIKEAAGQFVEIAREAVAFVKNNQPLVSVALKAAIALAGLSAAAYVVGTAVGGVVTAVSAVASVFGGLLTAAAAVGGILLSVAGGAFTLLASAGGIAVAAVAALPEILAALGIVAAVAVGAVVALGVAVAGAFYYFALIEPVLQEVRKAVAAVVTTLLDVFAPAIEFAEASLRRAWAFIGDFFTPGIEAIAFVLGHIVPTLRAIGGYFVTAFGPAAAGAVEDLGKSFGVLGEIFSEVWEKIVFLVKAGEIEAAMKVAWAGVKAAWGEAVIGLDVAWGKFWVRFKDGAKEAAGNAGHDLIDFVRSVAGMFIDVGHSINVFFVGVMRDIRMAMVAGVKGVVDMATAVAGVLPKAHPARLLLEAGATKAAVLANGAKENADAAFLDGMRKADKESATFRQVADLFADAIKAKLDKVIGLDRGASENELDKIDAQAAKERQALADELARAIGELIDAIPEGPEQGPEPRVVAELGPVPRLVDAARLGVATAGTFSGRTVGQSLGIGGSVQEEIQKNTKKTADQAEQLNANVKKLEGKPLKFD